MCQSFALTHICKTCQKNFLQPSINRRILPSGVEVVSFYRYNEIKKLLHTKHTDLGYHIYTLLAKNSFVPFGNALQIDEKVAIVAIDDNPKELYSHTAILAKSLQNAQLHYYPSLLRAKNDVSYSGKSKQFRLQNPREFHFERFEENLCILVDDIITTGTTLSEAITTMRTNDKEVLICLTLADAKS